MFHNKLLFVTHKQTHRSLQSKARYSSISPSASITLGNSSPLLLLGMAWGWVTSNVGRHKTALRPCTHNLPHTHIHSGMKNRLYRTLMISYKAHIHNPRMTHSLVFSLLWPPLEGTGTWAGVVYHWNPSSVGHTSCVPRILSHTNAPNMFNNQRLGCMIKVKLLKIHQSTSVFAEWNPILLLGANSRNRACFALARKSIFFPFCKLKKSCFMS